MATSKTERKTLSLIHPLIWSEGPGVLLPVTNSQAFFCRFLKQRPMQHFKFSIFIITLRVRDNYEVRIQLYFTYLLFSFIFIFIYFMLPDKTEGNQHLYLLHIKLPAYSITSFLFNLEQ